MKTSSEPIYQVHTRAFALVQSKLYAMKKVLRVFEDWHLQSFANLLSTDISVYFMYLLFGMGWFAQIIVARIIPKKKGNKLKK